MVFTSRELLNPTSVSYVLIGEHRSHRFAVYGQGKAMVTATTATTTSTAQAGQSRTIMDALNITNSGGDLLAGDVEEALVTAERALRRTQFRNRIRMVHDGFRSWLSDLDDFVPNEQQLQLAMNQRNATSQSLNQMLQAATQLANTRGGDLNNSDIVAREVEKLGLQMVVLTGLFPEARSEQRGSTGSSASAQPAAEGPGGNGPPNSAQPNQSSSFQHSRPRQSTTGFSNLSAETQPRLEFESVEAGGNGTILAGNWYQNLADAAAGRPSDSFYRRIVVSGNVSGVLGNVYGSQNPVPSQSQQGTREF
ncbi:hypothetical protein LTR05_001451 [Lithohypha guttulata]|uniref:Uncharacterized protein n=1 Tax=Lithohypha guttulata TaxID=1690604 RepID=A0AAN7T7U0_9EURO|nr:hypothetical protein LTR05_001451 [Lithohypha guttulata]